MILTVELGLWLISLVVLIHLAAAWEAFPYTYCEMLMREIEKILARMDPKEREEALREMGRDE